MATNLDFWKKKPSKSSNRTEKQSRLSSSSSLESFTFNLDDQEQVVDGTKNIDENEDTGLNDSISRISIIDNDP